MDSDNTKGGELGGKERVKVKQRYVEGIVYARKAKKNVSTTISAPTDGDTKTNEAVVAVDDTNGGVASTTPATVITGTKDGNIDSNNHRRSETPATAVVTTATINDDHVMRMTKATPAATTITTANDDSVNINPSTAFPAATGNENRDATPVAADVTITISTTKEKDNHSGNGHEKNVGQVHHLQPLALEDTNLAQGELRSRPVEALVYPSSLSKRQDAITPSMHELDADNILEKQGLESRVKINLKSQSKQEKRELREKMERELGVVRSLMRRIEEKGQLAVAGFGNSRISVNSGVNNEARLVSLEFGSLGMPHESTTPISTPTPRKLRPFDQLRLSVMDNNQGLGEIVEKEKRTPKANLLYRNSEFFLAKDKFPPSESNRKSKANSKKHGGGDFRLRFSPGTKVFKRCSALLEKLMKHKHGWVFNTPVDVVALGLHDYFTVIKHPMDLGTVKSRLNKKAYKVPEEFADDVRLTFHNALRYNPEGQDVHVMADQLLAIFEDKWAVIKSDYDRELMFGAGYQVGYPTPRLSHPSLLPPPPLDIRKILERSDSIVRHSVDVRSKPLSFTPSSRTPALRKPKAKDPNKRDMTYEEKQKLSTNLQNLPPEKLDGIVQIVKKRNSTVAQNDEEIEVDIDSIDVETLWELDRFVTNYKKNLSKHKRKAEIAMKARAEAEQNVQQKQQTQSQAPTVTNETGETKIDERNLPSSLPVQVEKEGDNRSQSSNSSSSSTDSESSSSDSDSDSSSASESDVRE